MIFQDAQTLLAKSFREGRLAHAYILVGDPRGDAMRFAEWIHQLVLCETPAASPCGHCRNCLAAAAHKMVDAKWLEPEKLSRVFPVDLIRETVIPWASCTSLEGGWKSMVFSFADRFNAASANAFLKTLEEPPPRTLFLLTTSDPASMLPTILSRCQRIDLSMGRVPPAEPWRSTTGEILALHSNRTELAAMATAGRLEALLAQIDDVAEQAIKDELKDSDAKEDADTVKARVRAKAREIRTAVFVSIQDWYRDLLVLVGGAAAHPLFFEEHRDALAAKAARLSQRQVLDCIDFVQQMAGQIDNRNIPVSAALSYWLGRLL